jgi:hypothetical protein
MTSRGCSVWVRGDGRHLRRDAPLTTRLPRRKMARPATEGRPLTVTFIERHALVVADVSPSAARAVLADMLQHLTSATLDAMEGRRLPEGEFPALPAVTDAAGAPPA